MDAVDNLSHMAELDLSSREDVTKLEGLTEAQVSERMQTLSWHDREYRAFNQERIKETFVVVQKYIRGLCEEGKGYLKEDQVRRGIQAIMILVSEAAQKVDNFTQIFKGEKEAQSVTELKEYKELQHFYLTKVSQRFHTVLEVEGMWQEEWGSGESDAKKAALKDLETVRKDREYELFLIRKEDGTPYFNRDLLRHMQLVGQFDSLLADPTMQDPFLKIRTITDKDAYKSAKEILKLAAPYVDEFTKDAMKFKNIAFVSDMSKSLMALMLAANSRNLIQNAIGKSSINYYADFHYYLRSAVSTPEYRKIIASSQSSGERFIHAVTNLSHVLCGSFFLKVSSHKDMIELIHTLINKGTQGSVSQGQTSSPLSFWNNLRDHDDSIRYLLKNFPNGPLLKTIQLFTEDKEMKGFDPILQQNYPMQLYTFSGDELHVSCVRVPCPVSQTFIAKATITPEFEGFLRSLKGKKGDQRYLLINCQDRTSWHEHARCKAVEEVQKESEFTDTLMTVTLPKNTDFYMQSGAYVEWDDAEEFMKQLKEQIASKEQCGFYFPPEINEDQLLQFSEKAIKAIHTVFFDKKERLVHKNRLDFIEIFYLMLTLKLVEEFKPDIMSFTCKDAVDTGAVSSAGMYAFLRMMNDSSHFSKEEKDFLLWMLYAPALATRERAVDFERLNRMISALAIVGAELEAHNRSTVASCAKLYKLPFFNAVKVREATA